MKKFVLFISSFFAGIGSLYSQIVQFKEVPDSLNPFIDLDIEYNSGPPQVYIDDYNDDGFLDVILFRYNQNNLITQNGLGSFSNEHFNDSPLSFITEFMELPSSYFYTRENLHFIDFDSDGDTDIAIDYLGYSYCGSCYGCNVELPGRIRFYENNGSNEYDFVNQIDIGNNNEFSFIDIDGDGDLDFVSHSEICGTSKYYDEFIEMQHVTYEKEDTSINYIASSIPNDFDDYIKNYKYFDLDQDGDRDALYTTASPSFMWKERFSQNNFGTGEQIPIVLSPNAELTNFDFGDLNNNGLIDLIIFDPGLNTIRYYEQDCQNAINGNSCDDGLPCTENDIWQDCICKGTPIEEDADGDGICDVMDSTNGDCTLGAPCDSSDLECAQSGFLDENCECTNFSFIYDFDGDGVCDPYDQCPGQNDNADNNQNNIPDCLEYFNDVEIEIVDPITSLPDEISPLEKQIKIFPNPSSGIFTIDSKLKIQHLKLYNAIGEEMPVFISGQNQIDLSLFSKGIYFVELKTEEGILRKKLIKE